MTGDKTKIPEATVLEIQRMSTEDGPGIRTTVFFKGCSLKCTWCHNPESISPDLQRQWVGSRCIGCKICLETCKHGALKALETGIEIDRTLCKACGECVEECPSTAMEMIGSKWTVDDLVAEVVKDEAYFRNSGGGVTASGGEAALQAPFVSEFFKRLQEQGIHTILDTCGQCSTKALQQILPHTDMVLFDLKEADPEAHKQFTGAGLTKIHSSLLFVRDTMKENGVPKALWIRTPIIPGTTARSGNIREIGKWIAENLDGVVDRWELCSFNNLCKDKYARLGIKWEFEDAALISKEDMEQFAAIAKKSGVDPKIVHWSGSTALETVDGEDEEEKPALRAVKGCRTC